MTSLVSPVTRHFRAANAHGRWWITVHGTIVSVHFNKDLAVLPVLRHADHGIIDRTVPVRVEIPHDISDRLGRLAVAFVMGIAILIHQNKRSAVEQVSTIQISGRARSWIMYLGSDQSAPHDALQGHILNISDIRYKPGKYIVKIRNLLSHRHSGGACSTAKKRMLVVFFVKKQSIFLTIVLFLF